jgi:hypothetical protein
LAFDMKGYAPGFAFGASLGGALLPRRVVFFEVIATEYVLVTAVYILVGSRRGQAVSRSILSRRRNPAEARPCDDDERSAFLRGLRLLRRRRQKPAFHLPRCGRRPVPAVAVAAAGDSGHARAGP